jgi:putative redox protein
MKTIQTIYKGNLRTAATHLQSGTEIITDAPTDNHGLGAAFSPTDLLAASLGSCMLTIMGIAAKAHHLNIDGASLSITKIMAAEPRRVKEIIVEFDLTTHTYSEKEKIILEKAARTCPVALSLHPDLTQTLLFKFK